MTSCGTTTNQNGTTTNQKKRTSRTNSRRSTTATARNRYKNDNDQKIIIGHHSVAGSRVRSSCTFPTTTSAKASGNDTKSKTRHSHKTHRVQE
jgi:hypothetical protein